MSENTENYKKGLEVLSKIDPHNYQNIVNSFKDSAAPDLGTLAVEFNYGQIFFQTGIRFKIPPSCSSCWSDCFRKYRTIKVLY